MSGAVKDAHPARSALGAPFGGAGSRRLTEGVRSDEWNQFPAGTVGADRIRPQPQIFASTRLNGTTSNIAPFNAQHPLSFAFAQQLPQRWSRGRFAPRADAIRPYRGKDKPVFEW